MIRASIIVATYNRQERLARLLSTLAKQTLPRDQYEVVVVDDGSREDATPTATAFTPALQVSVLRQSNSGVAVARQRGVLRAHGRIVVFVDDDMLVPENFVAQHLAAHGVHDDRVVMGELLPDAMLGKMPLFERFHAHLNEKAATRFAASGTFAGHDVYTGNLSLPRDLFLRVGGFDSAFFIEDVELGIRLEKAGAKFVFSRAAGAVHASDHTSLDKWLARSKLEGREWVRLLRKHPSSHDANPWRFFSEANPLSRPFFGAAAVVPAAAVPLARLAFQGASRADELGLGRAMVAAMTLVYGIQYFAGVREETGSLKDTFAAYRAYRSLEKREIRSRTSRTRSKAERARPRRSQSRAVAV